MMMMMMMIEANDDEDIVVKMMTRTFDIIHTNIDIVRKTMMSYYKAAGLRYMVNRSTKTVINVDVASLAVAS